MRPNHILIVLALECFSYQCRAQQSVNTSGGDANGTGGSVAYSVGQVDHIATEAAGGTVYQGVQQPFEFLVLEVEPCSADVQMRCYPNPTSDHLVLDATSPADGLSYSLLDTKGRLVMTDRINGLRTIIPTSAVPAATYLLEVKAKDGTIVKSYQVIKTH